MEVDIEYPEHVHDTHSAYTLALEAISDLKAWLGYYHRTLVNKMGGKCTECVKLVPNLRKKNAVWYTTDT